MPILTEAQFTQLQARINSLPLKDVERYLSWEYNGRSLTEADFPAANEMRRQQIRELLSNRPNPQEQDDWRDISAYLNAVSEQDLRILVSKLEMYISRWERGAPSGNHLDEASASLNKSREKLIGMTRRVEEEQWNKVDHLNFESLLAFYADFPYTMHKNDIDDEVYSLVSNIPYNTDITAFVARLNRYKECFPAGKHLADADRLIHSACDWYNIKAASDLQNVFIYVRDNENSPFIIEARTLLMTLKNRELEEMRRQFNDYPRERLLSLVSNGVFTHNELAMAGVATNRSLEILNNYQAIRHSLPNLDNVIHTCMLECFENHTDVFMFGIPATGKSCVLAGLLNAPIINYDSVKSGGPYADALREFLDSNCPPDPTKKNYLTAIKAKIRNGDKDHLFDLVEMAGEEFADKIAQNPEGVVGFEDMGTGAAGLLTMPNRKVFFLIVDPTKETIVFNVDEEYVDDYTGQTLFRTKTVVINQRASLKRMIDMFNQPENKEILRKVDAIHFIVTKADTLGDTHEERIDKAVELMNNRHSDAIRTLAEVCEEYGINRATKGVPYVFPFSLGRFYVGNICEYDDHDSNSLLKVMMGNTMAIKKNSFWDKFKRVMNKGF